MASRLPGSRYAMGFSQYAVSATAYGLSADQPTSHNRSRCSLGSDFQRSRHRRRCYGQCVGMWCCRHAIWPGIAARSLPLGGVQEVIAGGAACLDERPLESHANFDLAPAYTPGAHLQCAFEDPFRGKFAGSARAPNRAPSCCTSHCTRPRLRTPLQRHTYAFARQPAYRPTSLRIGPPAYASVRIPTHLRHPQNQCAEAADD